MFFEELFLLIGCFASLLLLLRMYVFLHCAHLVASLLLTLTCIVLLRWFTLSLMIARVFGLTNGVQNRPWLIAPCLDYARHDVIIVEHCNHLPWFPLS